MKNWYTPNGKYLVSEEDLGVLAFKNLSVSFVVREQRSFGVISLTERSGEEDNSID